MGGMSIELMAAGLVILTAAIIPVAVVMIAKKNG